VNKKLKTALLIFILVPALAVAGLIFAISSWYHGGPWSGRIVDAETKQPIEGAAVVFVWESTFSVPAAGVNYNFLDAEERVSDKDGRFSIPKKTFLNIPMFRAVQRPNAYIFKPGYGTYPTYDSKKPILAPVPYFQDSTIELPKIASIEERRKAIPSYPIMDYSHPNIIPYFNKLRDEEIEYVHRKKH